jgi:hypothetical protein
MLIWEIAVQHFLARLYLFFCIHFCEPRAFYISFATEFNVSFLIPFIKFNCYQRVRTILENILFIGK